MINGEGLVNDGLDSKTCRNNRQATWTYNQGVMLGGLALLADATGNATLLRVAESIASAAAGSLVWENGVLQVPRRACCVPYVP